MPEKREENRLEKYPLGGRKQVKFCDHPDCDQEGSYRAPKSQKNLRDYYWFCLDHVREYNAGWNFCEGMDQSDIDTMIKTDACWGRPTWPLGNGGSNNGGYNGGTNRTSSHGAYSQEKNFKFNGRIYDPFEVYQEATAYSAKEKKRAEKAKEDAFRAHPEMEAYLTLGFDYPAAEEDVKRRYKQLAKDLHPDLNRDDPKAEERLKVVNEAYTRLKKSFS